MRLRCGGVLFYRIIMTLCALSAISPQAISQIIPAPGFTADQYVISKDSAIHLCWLDGTDLIYAATQSSGRPHLIKCNYRSKVDTDLPNVNAVLDGGAVAALKVSDICVSPDGTRTVWPITKNGRGGFLVGDISGKQHRFVEAPVPTYTSWAPDTGAAICFSSSTDGTATYSRAAYYDVKSGEIDSDFHIARRSGLAGRDDGFGHVFMMCFFPLSNHRAWAVTVPPAFKTGSTRFGLGGAVVLGLYELSNTAVAKTGYAIDLPPTCDLIRANISPHQKYVIWQLGFALTTELWISDINGKHMRRAATLQDEKNATFSDAEPPISDVSWLPMGRSIGCRLGGVLYIIHLDIPEDQPEP